LEPYRPGRPELELGWRPTAERQLAAEADDARESPDRGLGGIDLNGLIDDTTKRHVTLGHVHLDEPVWRLRLRLQRAQRSPRQLFVAHPVPQLQGNFELVVHVEHPGSAQPGS
jgi:hypothetical protein